MKNWIEMCIKCIYIYMYVSVCGMCVCVCQCVSCNCHSMASSRDPPFKTVSSDKDLEHCCGLHPEAKAMPLRG